MSKAKAKAPPVDKATPKLKLSKRTDADKVAATRSTTQVMQASPGWASAPDVQSASKTWNAAADSLETNSKLVASLLQQLRTAVAAQRVLRQKWSVATKQVASNINVVCDGSADAVKAFGWDVATHAKLGPLTAVADVTTAPGLEAGQAGVKWDRGLARHGFLVQHATNPQDATTYSGTIACTKSRITLGGLGPSGSTVYFRVAAIDPASPTNQTPWSGWVAASVR